MSLDAIVRTLYADVLDEKETAGMEDFQRRRSQRPRRSDRISSDRCGSGRRLPTGAMLVCVSRSGGLAFDRRAVAGAMVHLAARRLVAEPAAGRAAGPPVRPTARFSGQAVAADLAILRGLCHGGGQLAPARQYSGTSASGSSPRAPARPTSAWRCWRTWPPTTSATAPPADCSTARRRRSTRWNRMERYRGHFYNWYDTRSLKPLTPRYVSTVDSGNLVGHLLVLAQRLARTDRGQGVAAPNLGRARRHGAHSAWTWLAAFNEAAAGSQPAAGCRRRPARRSNGWSRT